MLCLLWLGIAKLCCLYPKTPRCLCNWWAEKEGMLHSIHASIHHFEGYPTERGHFPIISQSVRQLLSTLMDQTDLTTGTKSSQSSSLPHSLLYSIFVYFFFLSQSAYGSLPPPSRIFSLSCFQHFGPAVHKSLVISLWHTLAPLRQPVVWFSLKLIFVPSDTLYVSASVSRTQFGRSEFSSQRSTFYSLFMRENGIKSVHYRLQFFWPGILFSLAAALKVCWNRPFFHVYKWAPFMNPWGNACFLKQFKRILHRTQSGGLDLRSVFTHSIILRLI